MSKRRVYAVLVGCALVNVLFTLDQPSYLINNDAPISLVVSVNVNVGFALLFFPLMGLLADVCFTRYQMMKTCFIILSTTLILVLLVAIIVHIVLDVMLQKSMLKYIAVALIVFSVGTYHFWNWLI